MWDENPSENILISADGLWHPVCCTAFDVRLLAAEFGGVDVVTKIFPDNCRQPGTIERKGPDTDTPRLLGGDEITIRYESYRNEREQLPLMTDLIQNDLSEPYSIFTYRSFLQQCPFLCVLAYHGETLAGVIVNRAQMSYTHKGTLQGYIAMLSVKKSYRHLGIGSNLVKATIDLMRCYGVKEIFLETELKNKAALALYTRLGFVRTRFLPRYYLNGNDALELQKPLWVSASGLNDGWPVPVDEGQDARARLMHYQREIADLANMCIVSTGRGHNRWRPLQPTCYVPPYFCSSTYRESRQLLTPDSWLGKEDDTSPPKTNAADRRAIGDNDTSQVKSTVEEHDAECECEECRELAKISVPWLLNVLV